MQIYLMTGLLLLSAVLGFELRYQFAENQTLKAELKQRKTQLKAQLKQVQDMQVQLAKVHRIDKKTIKELSNAKQTIKQLKRDVYVGNKRLRLKAACSKPVPNIATTASVVNGRTCELNRDAREDYFNLRAELKNATIKIKGLQSYIKALPVQCVQGGKP